MSIIIPENTVELYSLKNAKTYLNNAITNLTNQISLYSDGDDNESKNNCTKLLNGLVQEYNKICALIEDIPLSQAYLKGVDKLNDSDTDSETIGKRLHGAFLIYFTTFFEKIFESDIYLALFLFIWKF